MTINSTPLPKIALINAPSKSPDLADNLSDNLHTCTESGIMAKKLKVEVTIEFMLNTAAARPSGTNAQSTLMLSRSTVAVAA